MRRISCAVASLTRAMVYKYVSRGMSCFFWNASSPAAASAAEGLKVVVTARLAPKAVDRAPPKKDLRDDSAATDDAGAVTGASPVADPELPVKPTPLLVVLYAAAIEPRRGIKATNAIRQNRRDIMVADARVREEYEVVEVSDREPIWTGARSVRHTKPLISPYHNRSCLDASHHNKIVSAFDLLTSTESTHAFPPIYQCHAIVCSPVANIGGQEIGGDKNGICLLIGSTAAGVPAIISSDHSTCHNQTQLQT